MRYEFLIAPSNSRFFAIPALFIQERRVCLSPARNAGAPLMNAPPHAPLLLARAQAWLREANAER
jgi:hypothetical protein